MSSRIFVSVPVPVRELLQNTAECCKTLRNAAKHCGMLQSTAECCKTLRNAAKHCGILPRVRFAAALSASEVSPGIPGSSEGPAAQ